MSSDESEIDLDDESEIDLDDSPVPSRGSSDLGGGEPPHNDTATAVAANPSFNEDFGLWPEDEADSESAVAMAPVMVGCVCACLTCL